jgi:uncharacterized membrane protein YkgB
MNKEGELIPVNYEWHIPNNTYGFSKGLGVLLVSISVIIVFHPVALLN